MASRSDHGLLPEELSDSSAAQDSYLAYKKRTNQFVVEMITKAKFILRTQPTTEDDFELLKQMTRTGTMNVAALVALAELISRHTDAVYMSGATFRMLLSIIQSRKAQHTAFVDHLSIFPDAEIQRSNDSHKHFIDTLIKVFTILGGNAWLDQQMAFNNLTTNVTHERDVEEVKEIIFSNKFASLKLDHGEDNVESDSDSDTSTLGPALPKKSKKRRGKGKKKQKKKKKGLKQDAKQSKVARLEADEVSLDSYRILEEDDDLMTSYVTAVCAFKNEWLQTRSYITDTWHEVAFEDLNGAVAGAVSNLAVAKVKHTEAAISLDFPANGSYHDMIKSLTNGDPKKFQLLAEARKTPSSHSCTDEVDIKEQLMIYAYDDLVDFISDFQKCRNGKPSKKMKKELGAWDPDLDLQAATKQQRLEWRRTFTINWLYDLVNVYTSMAQRERGRNCLNEEMDWSVGSRWGKLRFVFGLTEFASDITTFATQKNRSDFRRAILPHHVFQLQCIVDATAVGRGWISCTHGGHHMEKPPTCQHTLKFINTFLGDMDDADVDDADVDDTDMSDPDLEPTGYLVALKALECMLKHDEHTIVDGHLMTLVRYAEWFCTCLGSSMLAEEAECLPPSRFKETHPNGLWEFSPYLCGVGLAEGLQMAFNVQLIMWDNMLEPWMMLQLQNMMVVKGHLQRPLVIYNKILTLFEEPVFQDNKPPPGPDVDFNKPFAAMTRAFRKNRTAAFKMQRSLSIKDRTMGCAAADSNIIFKVKTPLTLYHDAGWNPSRIPDKHLHPRSALAAVRLTQTKEVTNPVTGETEFEETELVRHIREHDKGCDCDGNSRANFKNVQQAARNFFSHHCEENEESPDEPLLGFGIWKPQTIYVDLQVAKIDFTNDINGLLPYSGINYPRVTMEMIETFGEFETELRKRNSKLHDAIFQKDNDSKSIRRLVFTASALNGNEEIIQGVANVLQRRSADKNSASTRTPYYWELEDPIRRMKGRDTDGTFEKGACEVM
ncbi:hypothetical protein Cob_v003445 [Colletotrichum orbiculare MAFF 240422]|uniref:DUF6604 domain-containing protein n=1 Tax=Colletotrichum orbiculare (strain 104-T / ATCC 96160 / CBS 514.97 / LARS 414 / MAFF 240422) TaxID=1213857 RepID=N4VJ54_COLOR|nr:hypothetical protein Cob_v003445 [Colletotrichum orbiculare MAFF 240422]